MYKKIIISVLYTILTFVLFWGDICYRAIFSNSKYDSSYILEILPNYYNLDLSKYKNIKVEN